MVLPYKITPDKIKDSIVILTVKYEVEYEEIIGSLITQLRKSKKYNFITSSPKNDNTDKKNFLFFNEFIKFQINKGTININCNRNYIGWKKYRDEIKYIIDSISKLDFDINVTSLGLRYISEFKETNLDDNLTFSFSFGQESIKSKQYSFSSQFVLNGHNVILTLRNEIPTVEKDDIIKYSHIDIDISNDDLNINFNEVNDLLVSLDKVHNEEKQVFFNLLKSEYLEKLNPKY